MESGVGNIFGYSKFLIFAVAMGCMIQSCTDEPAVSDVKNEIKNEVKTDTIRVLAIGNSFSEDAVEQHLYELAKADNKCIIIGNMYIAGCDLGKHLDNIRNNSAAYSYRKVINGKKRTISNVSIATALDDEEWDYVSLQQVSGSSGLYNTYTPLGEIIENITVREPGAKIAWHTTWAYQGDSNHPDFPKYYSDQLFMYNAIQTSVLLMLTDYPEIKLVIPTGTAIQNGRTSFIGDNFTRDGYHLNSTYGRFTAACTWYEALTGVDVTQNSYRPANVTDEQSFVARYCAHYAVQNPFTITASPL